MRLIAPVFLAGVLAGCQPQTPERNGAAANDARTPLSQQAKPEPAPAPLAIPARLGPVTIGMNADALPGLERDAPMEGSACSYGKLPALKDAFLMLDGDRIVRIDVRTPDLEAVKGVRVGAREADAIKAMGPDVEVQPHPYTGPKGHYLALHTDGAPLGLIAETDGEKVLTWRFGQWEQVRWIEGCA